MGGHAGVCVPSRSNDDENDGIIAVVGCGGDLPATEVRWLRDAGGWLQVCGLPRSWRHCGHGSWW